MIITDRQIDRPTTLTDALAEGVHGISFVTQTLAVPSYDVTVTGPEISTLTVPRRVIVVLRVFQIYNRSKDWYCE